MIPTAPGVYTSDQVSMAEYLAIKAMSASLVKTMVDECPAKARFESPWNPQRPADNTDETDRGEAAHMLLMDGNADRVAVFNPEDYVGKRGGVPVGWTNDAIREARDAARAAGRIPMLAAKFQTVIDMNDAVMDYLLALDGTEAENVHRLFADKANHSEVTLLWDEHGVLCKARPDRIAADATLICDYKTSAMSVEPNRWGRVQLVQQGYHVTAAWYRRAVQALHGVQPEYIFLNQECDPPYLCSLCGVNKEMLAIAEEKCRWALSRWAECVEANYWPSYPLKIVYPEMPAYELTRWTERQTTTNDGIDYGSQA